MIAIVDSGGANIASLVFAFERLGASAELTADKEKIKSASHIVLPGVGAAKDAMKRLNQLNLTSFLCDLTQPVLGICLGMQLLYDSSEEGNATCLGIIPGEIAHLETEKQLPIPHMGWNRLLIQKQSSELFQQIPDKAFQYFIHSFAAPLNEASLATSEYGQTFTAACQWRNYYGVQFHPEKSGEIGTQILKNFLEITS